MLQTDKKNSEEMLMKTNLSGGRIELEEGRHGIARHLADLLLLVRQHLRQLRLRVHI